MMDHPISGGRSAGVEEPGGSQPPAGRRTGRRTWLRARALAALATACVPVVVAIAHPDLSIRGGGIADAPGLALVLGGGLVALWSYLVCAKWGYRGGTTPDTGPSHMAVQGPYGRSRNPFDLGVGLLLLGELYMMPSATLAIYVAACVLAAHWMVTRREEPALARRFGRAYAAYAEIVPRWIPRPTRSA